MVYGIFGSDSAEQTLLAIQNYGEGYARGIAELYAIPHSVVQKQLLRLEREGVLVSQLKGRTRLFTWNPRYPLQAELSALLERALAVMPRKDRKRWFLKRQQRPRRTGKAL